MDYINPLIQKPVKARRKSPKYFNWVPIPEANDLVYLSGMCSWKEMKQNPEWKDEYENNLEIKKVHMCKSCGKSV